MGKIERFEDLKCWQEARLLVRMIYGIANSGPLGMDIDMKRQLRRAAISTMNNIAEGFGRFSRKEFIRFLEMSLTSANEIKSVCYVAMDVNYLSEDEAGVIQKNAEKLKAMNLGLIRYLRRKQ